MEGAGCGGLHAVLAEVVLHHAVVAHVNIPIPGPCGFFFMSDVYFLIFTVHFYA